MRRPQARSWVDWAYPIVVLLALVVLTATALNGSSSGALRGYTEGSATPDRDLLLGHPRGIRSDEWLVSTPLAVAQARSGNPRINEDLAGGEDVSVVFEVATHDWSVVFKPTTWGWLVLPIDNARAFQWWSGAAALLLAAYSFTLSFLPRRRLLGVTIGLTLLYAPFTQWWYGSSNLIPMASALAAIAVCQQVLHSRGRRQWAWAALLAWITGVMGLVLYPPFQIPCVTIALLSCLGLLFDLPRERGWRQWWRASAPVAAAGALGLVIIAFYALTRLEVFRTIADTVYPGHRVVTAGGFPYERFFSGLVDRGLTNDDFSNAGGLVAVGGNQSEAAAFIPLGLFCALPLVRAAVAARRRRVHVSGVSVVLPLLLLGWLAVLFIPGADAVARLLGLTSVPHERLQIGVGLLAVVMVVFAARDGQRLNGEGGFAVTAVATLIAAVSVGVSLRDLHGVAPAFTGSAAHLFVLTAFAAILAGLLSHWRSVAVGSSVLAAFSVYLTGTVHPVYRGVYDAGASPIGRAITDVDQRDPGAWVSVAGLLSSAVLEESGARAYSGVFLYPQFENWVELDPLGQYRPVYNRYAHVIFTDDREAPPIALLQADSVGVRFDPCGPFAQAKVRHVLTNHPWTPSPCLRSDREVQSGTSKFQILDVVRLP